jgi:hypothetical protein
MSTIGRVALWIVLALQALTATAQIAPDSLEITDDTGQKDRLSSPRFIYPGSGQDPFPHHLRLDLTGSPKQVVWIHSCKIKEARLQKSAMLLRVVVSLDDGTSISGSFPFPELKIAGKGALGDTTYPISRLQSLIFTEFSTRGSTVATQNEYKVVDRTTAAQQYDNYHQVSLARDTSGPWSIVDSATSHEVADLNILDAYETNSSYGLIYLGSTLRTTALTQNLTIQRGAGTVTMPLNSLATIEFTGQLSDGLPELIIQPRGEKKLTVQLLLRRSNLASANSRETTQTNGPPEADDYLVWRTPFGFKAVSFIPVRKLVVKSGIPSPPSPAD